MYYMSQKIQIEGASARRWSFVNISWSVYWTQTFYVFSESLLCLLHSFFVTRAKLLLPFLTWLWDMGSGFLRRCKAADVATWNSRKMNSPEVGHGPMGRKRPEGTQFIISLFVFLSEMWFSLQTHHKFLPYEKTEHTSCITCYVSWQLIVK